MNESQRLAYLDALGIQQYYAVQPIAGALPSPDLSSSPDLTLRSDLSPCTEASAPEASTPDAMVADPQPVMPESEPPESKQTYTKYKAPAAEPPSPQEVLPQESPTSENISIKVDLSKYQPSEANSATGSSGSTDTINQAPYQKAPHQKNQATKDALPRFGIAVIPITSNIVMLCELADHSVADMSAYEHQITANIIKALDYTPDELKPHYFRWPLVDNPRIPQGVNIAADSFRVFLEPKITASPAQVLALGQWPWHLLSGDDRVPAYASPPRDIAIGPHAASLVALPSLAQLGQQWQLKRTLWQCIAPLARMTP